MLHGVGANRRLHQILHCRSQWFCQLTGHLKKGLNSFFRSYLEDSTVQKPPAFSTSSPGLPPGSQGSCRGHTGSLFFPISFFFVYVNVLMTGLPPVGVPLVLDDQVLFMDGLQQRRSQGLEVGDGLRCDRQAAALLFQEQLLHCRKNGGNLFFFKKNELKQHSVRQWRGKTMRAASEVTLSQR